MLRGALGLGGVQKNGRWEVPKRAAEVGLYQPLG